MPPSTSSSYHPSSCCLTTSSPSDFLRPVPPFPRPSFSPPLERPPSPLPPFPRPSFSPPLLRPLLPSSHSIAHYTSSCIAQCTALPARVRSGPRKRKRRAEATKSPEVPIIVTMLLEYTSILRFLSFVPLTPELTIYSYSTASIL